LSPDDSAERKSGQEREEGAGPGIKQPVIREGKGTLSRTGCLSAGGDGEKNDIKVLNILWKEIRQLYNCRKTQGKKEKRNRGTSEKREKRRKVVHAFGTG